MEEVDAIVIHTLRQIGCEINEILSLKEFTTEIVIEGVVRCLRIINPSLEVSHHAPPTMSARYRLCSALAVEFTELGFKGEIGYQTFLYSNENDLRKIFLFLFEKLPKESEKVLEEPLGKVALILRETGQYFKECLNESWMPYYCKYPAVCNEKFLLRSDRFCVPFKTQALFFPLMGKTVSPLKGAQRALYYKNYMVPLCNQISSVSQMICSVLEKNKNYFVHGIKREWNKELPKENGIDLERKRNVKRHIVELLKQAVQKSNDCKSAHLSYKFDKDKEVKSSRFFHIFELQFASDTKQASVPPKDVSPEKTIDKEEERRKVREREITEIQEKIDDTASSITQVELQNKKLDGAILQISNLICKENEKVESMQEIYRVKKCTLSLLPDAENNIEKLQGLIESSSQRLVNLANQWEQHRVPLIEKYRELREVSSKRQNETQKKVEEIKQMHDKIRDTAIEVRHKEELHKQLLTSYEKLTKDLNRSAYTRRILEIVSNIKKQKSEIDKILLDTRNVQKEINRLSGKLERTFTVTDELIFRDAKKDEAVRRAYKLLAALHENCSQLVQITEDTGVIIREIRELEDQIEQENQKKVIATLERITSDYKQMQQENASLIAQLK